MTPTEAISAALSTIYSQRTGKDVKVTMASCAECRHKNRCMERSRNVVCTSYERRRKDDIGN